MTNEEGGVLIGGMPLSSASFRNVEWTYMRTLLDQALKALACLSGALCAATLLLWIACAIHPRAIGWISADARWTIFGNGVECGIQRVTHWPYRGLYLGWGRAGYDFPFTTPILLFLILPVSRIRRRLAVERILFAAGVVDFLFFAGPWIGLYNSAETSVQISGTVSLVLPVLVIWLSCRRWILDRRSAHPATA